MRKVSHDSSERSSRVSRTEGSCGPRKLAQGAKSTVQSVDFHWAGEFPVVVYHVGPAPH